MAGPTKKYRKKLPNKTLEPSKYFATSHQLVWKEPCHGATSLNSWTEVILAKMARRKESSAESAVEKL